MPHVAPLPFWPTTAERSERVIATVHVGSGRLVACDPFVMEVLPVPFARAIPPASYEVRLGVGDGDRAYLALVLGAAPVTQWEHARREGEGVHAVVRRAPGFDVDASAGAYMDRETASLVFRERSHARSVHDRAVAAGLYTQGWASLTLAPGLDMVAFSTGGDGNFPSFWGLDPSGAPSVLVTDLGVLREPVDDEAEEDGDPPSGPGAVVIPFPTRRR